MKDEIMIKMMDVEYPSEEAVAIQKIQILDKAGLEKKSIIQNLKEVYWGPGFKNIFYQCNGAWAITGIIYAIIIIYFIATKNSVRYQEFLIMMICPLMYMVFSFVSYFSEEQSSTIELKKTLHYSFDYIISLRMFYTSIIAALFNVMVLLLNYSDINQFWSICAVGISSNFLFATISLYLYNRFNRYYHVLFMIAVWIIFCNVLMNSGENIHHILFDVVPVLVHVIIAVCSLVLFFEYIRRSGKNNAYTYKC